MRRHSPVALAAVLILLLPALAAAQQEKRPLTHDDYDSWKSIRSQQISPDGRWVSYQIQPQDGDGELVLRNVRGGTEVRYERGTRAQFTRDSRFLVLLVTPPEDSTEAARDAGKRGGDLPQPVLTIVDLSDVSVTSIERVQNFNLPEEAGSWLAYLKAEEPTPEEEAGEAEEETGEPTARPAGARRRPGGQRRPGGGGESGGNGRDKEFGTELVLRSLGDGSETSLDSVLDYRFTEEAEYLLYIVSCEADSSRDGVYTLVPGQAASQPLITGQGTYKSWVLNEDESVMAFLTDRDAFDDNPVTWNLYGWRAGQPAAELWVSHTSTSGFPDGMSVSDLTRPSFCEDGSIVLFGIKDIPEPEPEEDEEGAEAEEEEEVAEFELWSWNDPYPYPQQKIMADRVRNQTMESVYHLDSGRFVQLADEELEDVSLHWSGEIAYGQTDKPYRPRISYDSAYYDFYLVDPMTGDRTLIVEESYSRISLSPLAGYVYWWGTDRHWHVYNVATGVRANLTYDLPVPVWRATDDRPQPMGSYGLAGWTDDEEKVLVYDEFDIWELNPDGTGARCITEGYGRTNGISFRYRRMDPEERTITPNQWLLLSATDTGTMASGVYRDRVAGSREPQQLHMDDYSFGSPQKAEDTDTILTTRQSFYEFPDLWITDMSFEDWQKISARLGSGRTRALCQRLGSRVPGDSDQAGELRPGEEIPHAGLHL